MGLKTIGLIKISSQLLIFLLTNYCHYLRNYFEIFLGSPWKKTQFWKRANWEILEGDVGVATNHHGSGIEWDGCFKNWSMFKVVKGLFLCHIWSSSKYIIVKYGNQSSLYISSEYVMVASKEKSQADFRRQMLVKAYLWHNDAKKWGSSNVRFSELRKQFWKERRNDVIVASARPSFSTNVNGKQSCCPMFLETKT